LRLRLWLRRGSTPAWSTPGAVRARRRRNAKKFIVHRFKFLAAILVVAVHARYYRSANSAAPRLENI